MLIGHGAKRAKDGSTCRLSEYQEKKNTLIISTIIVFRILRFHTLESLYNINSLERRTIMIKFKPTWQVVHWSHDFHDALNYNGSLSGIVYQSRIASFHTNRLSAVLAVAPWARVIARRGKRHQFICFEQMDDYEKWNKDHD